jgi:uncharacterized protein YcbK (DUF882 family)
MNLDDFACPCCGTNKITVGFFYKMKKVEKLVGVRLIINSGYRCKKHNREVGGSDTSTHRKGQAADIRVKSLTVRFLLLSALLKVGITRIGIGENYIHADDDKDKPPELIWVY